MAPERATVIPALKNAATRLRIDSARSTSEAGSGHPTSCFSAAELVAALFFAEMRFDEAHPHNPDNDRFVLSKGHAAPILYAAWAEAGLFDRQELLKLREIGSDLEGHPTPRLPFVDVATGSLGQGICAAVGSRAQRSTHQVADIAPTYCSATASRRRVRCGRRPMSPRWTGSTTSAASRMSTRSARAGRRCGSTTWNSSPAAGERSDGTRSSWMVTISTQILDAFTEARKTVGQPTMILARTVKGKGVSFTEGKEGWHGKPFKKGEELDRALSELQAEFVPLSDGERMSNLAAQIPRPATTTTEPPEPKPVAPPQYKLGEQVATREAYGTALAKLGEADARVVALDADVKNSTFSDKFEKALPDRFYQNFIAEQVMVGAAMGLAARGAIPFPSTFAAFLTRAADFIRMAAISNVEREAGRLARRRVDRRGRPLADGARGPGDVARAAEHHRPLPVRRVSAPSGCVGAGRGPSGPGLHPDQPAEDAGDLRRTTRRSTSAA